MTALRADTMECSPRLAEMVRRAALPISVAFDNYFSRYRIGSPGHDRFLFNCGEAKTAYLRLCETLTEPAAPSSPAQTAGASAPAHSIEPAAALIPPPAEVTAPPSDNAVTAAGATSPGASAAPISGAA